MRGAIEVTRNIAKGLHPVTLSSKGLPAALAELAERVPPNVIFDWPQSERLDLDPAVALHIYRIAEEALGNALRHADPQNVVMRLTLPADGCIALLIEDDGCGFDVTRRSSGMGLSNMKYRASAIDGSLTVESRAGAGTRVRCDFPLREGRANAAFCR
jgi:signal transduction histidine kinase